MIIYSILACHSLTARLPKFDPASPKRAANGLRTNRELQANLSQGVTVAVRAHDRVQITWIDCHRAAGIMTANDRADRLSRHAVLTCQVRLALSRAVPIDQFKLPLSRQADRLPGRRFRGRSTPVVADLRRYAG